MAQPYPISRESREEAIFFGDGGAVYGPFALKIFDIDDVEVWTKADGGTWTIAAPTVAKVDPAAALDEFTITFAAVVPLTTKIKVLSARVHERSAGITAGTKLSPDALEKELTKQGTILQELRRDIDRAALSEFGVEGYRISDELVDGQVLMKSGDRLVPGPNAEEIAAAEGYAESAEISKGLAEAARDVAVAMAGGRYSTVAAFVSVSVPLVTQYVEVAGYSVEGDSGAHIKRRIATPSVVKPWHLQSADGAWWQIAAPVIRPEMFASIAYVSAPYGATQVAAASDAGAALDAATEYATTFGVPCRLLGRMYKRTTEWVWNTALDIAGVSSGRWSPTLNQSVASGAGKPDGKGTIIIYAGTGSKTRKALGVTDCRTGGGVVANADSREPGYDGNFSLTNYYNNDANTTTGAAATAKLMSIGVYMPPGTHGIKAAGLRIMPSYNGMAGYEAGTLGLGDEWDIGFYFDNAEWCEFTDVKAVGYWRTHGRLIRAGIVETEGAGTPQTGCEHLMFSSCVFTGGAAGSAIRGPDLDRVIGVGSNYVEIEWRTNHPYAPTTLGNTFRLSTGTFFDFTGLSKTGSVLRLTGVTPDPSASGVTTSSQITPGSVSNGMDNITDYACVLSGLDHQGAVRATSASLGAARMAKPSACLELSGWRLNGYRSPFTEFMSHDDVGYHLHSCVDVNIGPNADIEGKDADGLGLGLVCIGSPAETVNTRVTNPAGQTFFLTVDARALSADFRPYTASGPARFPTAPAMGGYLQSNQFRFEKQQYALDNETFSTPPKSKRIGWKSSAGSPVAWYDDADDRIYLAKNLQLDSNLIRNSSGTIKLDVTGASFSAKADTFTVFNNANTTQFMRISSTEWRSGADNTYDLGTASFRMKTIYAATGAINTSDAREKHWLGQLSDAEVRAFARIIPLIGKFQWFDAVEKKGDDARIHIGVTVQDVMAAFEAEGLDPFRYAPICRDYLVEDVKKTRTVLVPKVDAETVLRELVTVSDGRAVVSQVAEDVKVQVFEDVPMFDAEGNVLLDAKGSPRLYRAPVLVEAVEEYTESEAVLNEDGSPAYRLGLRTDQLLWGVIAATKLSPWAAPQASSIQLPDRNS